VLPLQVTKQINVCFSLLLLFAGDIVMLFFFKFTAFLYHFTGQL